MISLHFAWFVSHLLSFVLSILTFVLSSKIFYILSYLCIAVSFAISLHQSLPNPPTFKLIISTDNAQYLILSVFHLLILPRITLSLLPYTIFSLFHSLNYFRTFILSNFSLSNAARDRYSNIIKYFIVNYNDISMLYACYLELLVLITVVLHSLLFQKGYWLALFVWLAFVKLRFEKSLYMRKAIVSIEVIIDGAVSDPRVPIFLRNGWLKFKNILRSLSAKHATMANRGATNTSSTNFHTN